MDPHVLCQRVLLLMAILCPTLSEGRQMCLSCAFQTGTTSECLDDPWNWPMGNVRARCPFKCSFRVRRDIKKDEFTYAYRGCTAYGEKEKEGCVVMSGIEICYVSCENDDYCNNWNATDVVASGLPSGLPSVHLSPLSNLFVALVIFVFTA